MSEDSDQERTEDATQRRLDEAKKRGQVPRSKELNTLVVTLTSAIMLIIYGKYFAGELGNLMNHAFSLTREQIHDGSWLGRMFRELVLTALQDFIPLFILLLIVALIGPLTLSGWSFSTEAMGFKFERLNPLEGLKRILSWHGLAELGKALVKFCLIALVSFWLLRRHFPELLSLGKGDLLIGIGRLGEILAWGFLFLVLALIIIAAADVPFQIWEHIQGLKMTRQEVRDEMKESEGRPEVKGRIRQMQREMSKRRMMAEVPKADVIITNPTHYAVALLYDQNNMGAPRLIAKGVDFLAMRIIEIAKQNGVPQVVAPALARSIYYHVELEKEIPAGLFQAVAQVLAFVYQLRKTGVAPKPGAFDNLPIPNELRR